MQAIGQRTAAPYTGFDAVTPPPPRPLHLLPRQRRFPMSPQPSSPTRTAHLRRRRTPSTTKARCAWQTPPALRARYRTGCQANPLHSRA